MLTQSSESRRIPFWVEVHYLVISGGVAQKADSIQGCTALTTLGGERKINHYRYPTTGDSSYRARGCQRDDHSPSRELRRCGRLRQGDPSSCTRATRIVISSSICQVLNPYSGPSMISRFLSAVLPASVIRYRRLRAGSRRRGSSSSASGNDGATIEIRVVSTEGPDRDLCHRQRSRRRSGIDIRHARRPQDSTPFRQQAADASRRSRLTRTSPRSPTTRSRRTWIDDQGEHDDADARTVVVT